MKVNRDLRVGLDYTYAGNLYADYQLSSNAIIAGQTLEVSDPWRVPSGGQFDLNASYRFKIGKCNATLYGNVNNLLDYKYIVDAYDGGTGTWDSAYRVFYAFGRTYSLKLKVNF